MISIREGVKFMLTMHLSVCGAQVAKTAKDQHRLHEQLEWVLPYYDPTTTRNETLEAEVRRLQVVKSFLKDSQREEAFERIVDLTKRIFDVRNAHVLWQVPRQHLSIEHLRNALTLSLRPIPLSLSLSCYSPLFTCHLFL
jgi:hypothetical protein